MRRIAQAQIESMKAVTTYPAEPIAMRTWGDLGMLAGPVGVLAATRNATSEAAVAPSSGTTTAAKARAPTK